VQSIAVGAARNLPNPYAFLTRVYPALKVTCEDYR
jgi:hypothetical protein